MCLMNAYRDCRREVDRFLIWVGGCGGFLEYIFFPNPFFSSRFTTLIEFLQTTGNDNAVSAIISNNNIPTVHCTRPYIVTEVQASCQEILDVMPAGEGESRFGPATDPLANVVTPFVINSCE